jgi:methionine sulfoxide reductase heme-binding subunit
MLHRATYFAAIAGVIHFYWKVKSDVRSPLFYGALVAILLLWRLGDWFSRRRFVVAAKLSPEGARVDTAR